MYRCFDCKYCKVGENPITKITGYMCKHPESLKWEDPLTGRRTFSGCNEMRTKGNECGKEGELFVEKKLSLNKIRRLFNTLSNKGGLA